jgi:hypothetical protein
MADFFKGLAGGFGTGLQFGQAMQQREERERLREAMGLTPQEMQQRQALPEELGRAQAETQALAAEDARMFGLGPQEQAAYAPQMPVEGQRVGLPRYQLAGQTYDRAPTQQEIQQARYGAMADVIAERDPARAMEMRQRLEEQAYQAQRRPLELQDLQGRIAGQAQQRELTGIQLGSAKRTEAELQRASEFSNFAAENPNLTTAELKDAAFKQFKFTPKQWQEAVNTRLGISDTEQKLFVSGIKDKLKGKNLQQLGSLYNSDPDFDDKTDLAIVPGKGGAVTLNFIDKASGRVTSTQSFKNEALATEYLNKQATEPETIGSWMMNLRKAESAIEAQGAATEASRATVGLRNAQIGQIQEGGKNATERADIVDKFEALTPEEQAGPKGQGLIKQFNLLNVKAGGQVSLGAAPRAAGPVKMDDLDKENLRAYRDWEKDPRNAKLPQGQKDAYAAQLGVMQFINRAAEGPTTGVGSNPYATPQQGVDTTRATPPAARPPAPAPAALSTENTKLLGRAGNTGYNVQLPDGTTQVMSISQLNKLGYQFPSGTGLQRAWYEDLLPRR